MIISRIDESNKAIFESLMPGELFQKLNLPSVFAIGAIAGEGEEKKQVAGVLVFSVDEGSSGEENLIVATIMWLYVTPRYRGKKAADQLMEAFWHVVDESGIENILCDVPMSEEYNQLCAYLESWGFQFFLIDRYELTVPLQDFLEIPAFQHAPSAAIKPLKQITETDLEQFLDKVQTLPGVLQELPRSLSAYDKDLSCVHVGKEGINGALLIQELVGGKLEVLLLRTLPKQQQRMGDLSCFGIHAAAKKYPPETGVHIVCRVDATGEVLDKLFPDVQPLLVRRGCYDNRPQEATEEGLSHETEEEESRYDGR